MYGRINVSVVYVLAARAHSHVGDCSSSKQPEATCVRLHVALKDTSASFYRVVSYNSFTRDTNSPRPPNISKFRDGLILLECSLQTTSSPRPAVSIFVVTFCVIFENISGAGLTGLRSPRSSIISQRSFSHPLLVHRCGGSPVSRYCLETLPLSISLSLSHTHTRYTCM